MFSRLCCLMLSLGGGFVHGSSCPTTSSPTSILCIDGSQCDIKCSSSGCAEWNCCGAGRRAGCPRGWSACEDLAMNGKDFSCWKDCSYHGGEHSCKGITFQRKESKSLLAPGVKFAAQVCKLTDEEREHLSEFVSKNGFRSVDAAASSPMARHAIVDQNFYKNLKLGSKQCLHDFFKVEEKKAALAKTVNDTVQVHNKVVYNLQGSQGAKVQSQTSLASQNIKFAQQQAKNCEGSGNKGATGGVGVVCCAGPAGQCCAQASFGDSKNIKVNEVPAEGVLQGSASKCRMQSQPRQKWQDYNFNFKGLLESKPAFVFAVACFIMLLGMVAMRFCNRQAVAEHFDIEPPRSGKDEEAIE